jgi:hypothetical protein
VREQVVCDVVWRVTVAQLDGSGQHVVRHESLGDFDTERDADQKLADVGFTRTQYGWTRNWVYQRASVHRVLIEQT